MTTVDTQTALPWRDSDLAPIDRARALLAEMTPEEKLQQLGSTWPGSEELEEAVAPLQDSHSLALTFNEAIQGGIGQITRPFGTRPVAPEQGMERLGELQRAVMLANRFGIPAVAHEECLTGLTAWRATVYPTPLGLAATFNPQLVKQMGEAIGNDMAALGVHQGLSPVLDVVRDYRWGRVEETLGEDPRLVAEMAAGYVEGLQSAGIIATLKHFVGYSASRGARNHAPVSVGQRELQDVLLIPFERAVVGSRVRSVMNSYTELDGIPTASDRELLTDLLRDQWGFEGTVVSDYWAIPFLEMMHRLVGDVTSAGVLALEAGLDVELPHTAGYTPALLDRVDTETLDRSVLRVLTQKAELGLLDADWQPPAAQAVDLNSPHNQRIAATLAEQSIVLLDNDGILPLKPGPARIAVVGPVADDPQCLFGCYSFPNHVLPNFPDAGLGVGAPSLLEALRFEFPDAVIEHYEGTGISNGDRTSIPAAVAAAEAADLTILAVGDRSGMFGHGTSGEGCDVLTLELPGAQDELARAVLAAAKQTVMVVISGRPYAIGELAELAGATVQAFLPGQEGGRALAGILAGRVDPSGRLPVQIPGAASAQPGTYLAPPLALRSEGISNIDPTPAYPFGHGKSFTTFTIDAPSVSASEVDTDGKFIVSAVVANVGDRAGVHVPQLYMTDPSAEVTRPVRQLIAFARVDLAPGESAEVTFRVHADITAYTGRDLRRRVEPGAVEFRITADAAESGEAATVTLTGQTRFVDHTRVLTVPVDVRVLETNPAESA